MPPDAAGAGAQHQPMLEAALAYARRGWTVVPVEHGGKKPINPDDPRGRDWHKLRGREADLARWFSVRPRNVGVILGGPSDGLVDIDLDAPEALALAPRFLPKTETVFGRASKPRAHWLYAAHGANTRQFKDPVRGDMLLELRSEGAQTVFPPSLHESGEAVEWDACGDPLSIALDQLARTAGALAAAALCARYWPAPGGRHDASLTLTAFLKRAGWSDERVAHFVASVVGAAGGDADFGKRLATARDAAARLAAARPLRGFPALADLVGEGVARKAGEWLGLAGGPITESGAVGAPTLAHGSHVAQARAALDRLRTEHGEIVFCEGRFWSFDGVCWRPTPDTEIRRTIYLLDAAPVRGRNRPVSLTKPAIDGVAHEMTVLAAADGFFDAPPRGFNCANGFVAIDARGAARLEPHDPGQRKRYVVLGAWAADAPATPPEGSLFASFLRGSFGEGEAAREITDLLAEAAGIAALGAATELKEPVALILFGPLAANGKSQVLALLRGMVSKDAAAALSPDTFSDEKRLVLLAGRSLNACDELGGAAMFSEPFKRIVSGEPIGARDVYKSALEFCPRALHVFATNELPAFRRGLDRGVQRRVLIVPMTRSIPLEQQIPHIAERILSEESDLVLAWAVAGASRALARMDLARPRACTEAKRGWLAEADVVLSWLFDQEEVAFKPDAWVASKEAYTAFKAWATQCGFTETPNINMFSVRVGSAGIDGVGKHRTSRAAGIRGLVLKRSPPKRG